MTTEANPVPPADDLVARLMRYRERLVASDRPNATAILDEAIRDARRAAGRRG